MRLNHIALWVNDLEKMRSFYMQYFDLDCNHKYYNPTKNFSSYFLSFETGARIELMHKPDIANQGFKGQRLGQAHIAISVGSKLKVDEMTIQLKIDGYNIVDGPRTTGDGYYESVILDPESNYIELTI